MLRAYHAYPITRAQRRDVARIRAYTPLPAHLAYPAAPARSVLNHLPRNAAQRPPANHAAARP